MNLVIVKDHSLVTRKRLFNVLLIVEANCNPVGFNDSCININLYFDANVVLKRYLNQHWSKKD